MQYRGYKYNGAIDNVRVDEKSIIKIDNGLGTMFLHDMFCAIPSEFYDADYIFIDPPWNLINVKTFYTKADMVYEHGKFTDFAARVFDIIRELHDNGKVKNCFIEIGFQNVDMFEEELKRIFGNVKRYESKYYNKNLCYILQGFDDGCFVDIPTEVKDELKVIDDIVRCNSGKGKCILDFCCGQGAVSRTAYKYKEKFVCSELNKNRLAVAVQDVQKMGGKLVYVEV